MTPDTLSKSTSTASFKYTTKSGIFVQSEIDLPVVDWEECVQRRFEQIVEVENVKEWEREDLHTAFIKFVDDSIYANEIAVGDALVANLLEEENEDEIVQRIAKLFGHTDTSEQTSKPSTSDFSSTFISLLGEHSTPRRIATLMNTQRRFDKEARELCDERDQEMRALENEHESMLSSLTQSLNDDFDTDDQCSPMRAVNALAAHIQDTSATYASKLSSLHDYHKQEYQSLVYRFVKRKKEYEENESDENSNRNQSPIPEIVQNTKLEVDESFTIYLGSQLKSMHNVKVSSCGGLPQAEGLDDDLTWRLENALSLYGRDLKGHVQLTPQSVTLPLGVDTSKFVKLSERSSELHFDSIETQLQRLGNTILTTNTFRPPPEDITAPLNVEHARVGDVFITRHSNLPHAHVVFHLVTDDLLVKGDVRSRHPSISGLHQTIRTCARYGITTITLPLLLTDAVYEDIMTTAWCLRRAELVYKCVKGFLMEIAAYGSTSDITEQQHAIKKNAQNQCIIVLPVHVTSLTSTAYMAPNQSMASCLH